MWIIRRVSPWQDRNRFYPIGNPVVFASSDKETLEYKKLELEAEQLQFNPLPNLWEYWDVECSKEMIKLNDYLIQHHDFPILNIKPKDNNYILDIDDIKHGLYPDDRFTYSDLWKIQDLVGIYYYRIDEVNEIGKFLLVVNNDLGIDFLNQMEFKVFETEQEGNDYLETIEEDSAEIIKIV